MITDQATFVFAKPRSVYLHIPFCVHHCGYCDFTVVAGRDRLIPAYLDALELEMSRLETAQEMDTIYLGGGTPTYLPARELKRLIGLVRYWFRMSERTEFTVEANPDGLDEERLQLLAEHGVNRISLGVQAFDDPTLATLERRHRGHEVASLVRGVQKYFDNISLDLIFGVPGQSLDTWLTTLRSAIELHPNHISAYGLTYEKGTRFWSRREKGDLQQVGDELECQMYASTMERLEQAGFEQYEVSSYSRAGFRSQHNQVYWSGLPYDAFGPGASRYINGRRETNHRSVSNWIRRLKEGQSPVFEIDELSAEDRAREFLVLGLRRCDGISRTEFQKRHRFDFNELAGSALQRHLAAGLMEEVGNDQIRLTRAGRMIADSVIVDFL